MYFLDSSRHVIVSCYEFEAIQNGHSKFNIATHTYKGVFKIITWLMIRCDIFGNLR